MKKGILPVDLDFFLQDDSHKEMKLNNRRKKLVL